MTEAEFDALIAAGTITENTLVWKDGMANWSPLKEVRPAGAGAAAAPPGWIRCTATGRFFPPEEIVYIEGKPYSAAAKDSVMQGLMQTGIMPEADFGRNGPPWENRSQLGFFTALIQTIKGVLFDPAITFEKMKREGGLGSPMLFAIIVGTFGTLVAIVYQLVFRINIQTFMPAASRQPFAAQAGMNSVVVIVVAIFTPFIIAIFYCFLASGILHLSLMLCSGIRRPFETTFRTNCYAFGATSHLSAHPLLRRADRANLVHRRPVHRHGENPRDHHGQIGLRSTPASGIVLLCDDRVLRGAGRRPCVGSTVRTPLEIAWPGDACARERSTMR